MTSEPRVVVGPSEHEISEPTRLQEQLDREILPCLERPGQWLGPWIPGSDGRREDAATVALWWPSPAPGPSLPEALEALVDRFSDPSPHRLALVTTPGFDLLAELRRCDLPYFSRPQTLPLRAHPIHLVWIDHAPQILDVLTLAGGAFAGSSRPSVVAAGPAAFAVAPHLDRLVDLRVDEPDLSRLVDHLLNRARENGAPDRTRLAQWIEAHAEAHSLRWETGRPDPPAMEALPADGPSPARGPRRARCRVLRRRGFAAFGAREVEIGVGGRRLDLFLIAASAARRAALDLPPIDRLLAELRDGVREEFLPLRVHLGLGLPDETEADRASILRLFEQLRQAVGEERRLEAEVSLYVPDADDLARGQCPVDAERAGKWLEELRHPARQMKVKLHEPAPGSAWVTGLLEHGGDRLVPVVRAVHAAGASSGESELAMDVDLWHKSLQAVHFGDLPWGRGPEEETQDARAETVPPSPTGLEELLLAKRPVSARRSAKRPELRETDRWERWQALVPRRFDYRIEYRIRGRTKFLSQGELGGLIARRCKQCDLPLATTGVVQPKLRMSFGPALPVGIEGAQEYVDLGLTRRVAGLQAKLAAGMPDGIEILSVRFLPPGQSRLALSRVARASYEARLDLSSQERTDAFETLSQRVEELLPHLRDGARDPSDPHHQVVDVRLSTEGDAAACLAFTLDLEDPGPKRKPHDFLELLLGDLVEDVRYIPIRRTRLLVRDDAHGSAIWRTPSDMVVETIRRIRDAEKTRA